VSRTGSNRRETRETRVAVELDLDGRGEYRVSTGIGFLDHMLEAVARHGRIDLTIEAQGDLHVDGHHTAEDVAICLGRALDAALGDRAGLRRMGHAIVPMDEALAMVAVDLSGRGVAVLEVSFAGESVGALRAEMIPHFLQSLALEARLSLHARILAGANDHHRAEALFKALARALHDATTLDPRLAGAVPSTKGVLG
jgi:imidazoleglycerol-phosphate dehydratase